MPVVSGKTVIHRETRVSFAGTVRSKFFSSGRFRDDQRYLTTQLRPRVFKGLSDMGYLQKILGKNPKSSNIASIYVFLGARNIGPHSLSRRYPLTKFCKAPQRWSPRLQSTSSSTYLEGDAISSIRWPRQRAASEVNVGQFLSVKNANNLQDGF